MPFYPPPWVPELPFDPPDSIPICDFLLDEQYDRFPHRDSRPPFVCGLTGKSYSSTEVRERVDLLARGLAKELGWQPNKGTEWDKVIGVFSVNTVCFFVHDYERHFRQEGDPTLVPWSLAPLSRNVSNPRCARC